MLKTGNEYLEGLRDGRVVYIGKERVKDVTVHPAYRNAARTIASFYDLKASPDLRDAVTYEEGGKRYSLYYLKARSKDDLQRRSDCHRILAEPSFGFLGRSPDYIASFVTGMCLNPGIFGDRAEAVTKFYDYMRENDIYAAHAIVSPQASRDPNFYLRQNLPNPSCRVVREEDDGVVVSGMKMLATGAILADEVWIGNILPLAPEAKAESITFSVPVNTPGVSLWSRRPIETQLKTPFDGPLSWQFDETDAMIMFENVKVPWERVFVHNDPELSRGLYIQSAAHAYGNHHSNVRYLVKLQLLVGLASRVAMANGADQIPAVRETLGRLSALEALMEGIIAGQVHAAEQWPTDGFYTYNRRMMYAGLNWGVENYSAVVDCLRELCGGGVFQMPADISVLEDKELGALFETYWRTPSMDAVSRMKIFKLAWDLVGSEFAGRHQQYEKFFPGASFIVRNHNFREAPWERWSQHVDRALEVMETAEPAAAAIKAAE